MSATAGVFRSRVSPAPRSPAPFVRTTKAATARAAANRQQHQQQQPSKPTTPKPPAVAAVRPPTKKPRETAAAAVVRPKPAKAPPPPAAVAAAAVKPPRVVARPLPKPAKPVAAKIAPKKAATKEASQPSELEQAQKMVEALQRRCKELSRAAAATANELSATVSKLERELADVRAENARLQSELLKFTTATPAAVAAVTTNAATAATLSSSSDGSGSCSSYSSSSESEEDEDEPATMETPRKARLRSRVAEELCDTEKMFVRWLRVLVDLFLVPLRKRAADDGEPSEQDLAKVFINVDVILRFNTVLLEQLEQATLGPPHPTIGEVFLKNAAFLKLYTEFIKGFDESLKTLDRLRSSRSFAAFAKAVESDPRCEKLDLGAILVMPVQRLPRYILLLRELLKQTPEGSDEFKRLTAALEKVSNVTAGINEAKRMADSRAMVCTIQDMVSGLSEPLMAEPSRRFVQEGDVVELRDDGKQRAVHLFLFSDLLLVTKRNISLRRKKRALVASLPLSGLRAAGVPDQPMLFSLQTTAEQRFVFRAPSETATSEWLSAIPVCMLPPSAMLGQQHKHKQRRLSLQPF